MSQALPADWAPGGEVVPTDFSSKVAIHVEEPCFGLTCQLLAQVAYFLKKYGEGSETRSENAKEETAVDNNVEDGRTEDEQMEEEEEEEESRQEESGDKEKMVDEMIGDYESQQKVFRKMRSTSNPSSKA